MKKVVVLAAIVCAVTMIGTSAMAMGPLRSVGVEAGYVSPDLTGVANANGTWIAGMFADLGLPMTNFYVNPFVNYWNWSDNSASSTSLRDWNLGANLKMTIPMGGPVSPFIAAGASAHMFNAEAGDLTQSDTKWGFQAGAGVKIGVSQSANIVTSGWYDHVEDANNWSARAGLAWTL
jgi:opacity protein-like surface antigen